MNHLTERVAGLSCVAARSCGGCTECCTALAVKSLDKPDGVKCVHLVADGCGIYANRPDDCRAFMCLWLTRESTTDRDRPDRCGVVLSATSPKEPVNQALQVLTVLAVESRPGAIGSYHGERVLKAASQRMLLNVARCDGTRTWRGPARWMRALSRVQIGRG